MFLNDFTFHFHHAILPIAVHVLSLEAASVHDLTSIVRPHPLPFTNGDRVVLLPFSASTPNGKLPP